MDLGISKAGVAKLLQHPISQIPIELKVCDKLYFARPAFLNFLNGAVVFFSFMNGVPTDYSTL